MSVNEYILVIFKNHKHKAKYFLKAKKDILHAVTYIHWFFITLTIISFVTVLSLQFFFIAVLAYQKCSMFLPLKFLLYSDWVIDVNTLQWLSYPILFFFFSSLLTAELKDPDMKCAGIHWQFRHMLMGQESKKAFLTFSFGTPYWCTVAKILPWGQRPRKGMLWFFRSLILFDW